MQASVLVQPASRYRSPISEDAGDESDAAYRESTRATRSRLRLAESGPPAPLRILVVDDEDAIRALCRVNLELAGFEVTLASSGAEALEAVGRETPDLILLDVMMPGVDGWEVAERGLAAEATRDVPIVFLSARAMRADRQRGFDVGAVGYVVKPFDPIGLSDTLQRMLERLAHGERDELRQEMLEQA